MKNTYHVFLWIGLDAYWQCILTVPKLTPLMHRAIILSDDLEYLAW